MSDRHYDSAYIPTPTQARRAEAARNELFKDAVRNDHAAWLQGYKAYLSDSIQSGRERILVSKNIPPKHWPKEPMTRLGAHAYLLGRDGWDNGLWMEVGIPSVLDKLKDELSPYQIALSGDLIEIKQPEEVDVVPDFICPITQEKFKDPVVASDGRTYEQAAIQKVLDTNGISPITRATLRNQLYPNYALLGLVEWEEQEQEYKRQRT